MNGRKKPLVNQYFDGLGRICEWCYNIGYTIYCLTSKLYMLDLTSMINDVIAFKFHATKQY